jgi:hypothetical protein
MKRQFHTPTCRVYVRNYYVNTQPTNREGHVGPSYSDTRGVTLFPLGTQSPQRRGPESC